MSRENLTLIINTYPKATRQQDLERLLASIYRQSYTHFKILLIENYKNKDYILPIVRKALKKELSINVICNPVKKLSVLFDLGWRSADTDYLAFIADDVELEPTWLELVLKELVQNKKTAVVTGPLISTTFPTGEMHRIYLLSQKNLFTKLLSWPYLFFTMEDDILKPGKLFESGAYSIGQALPEAVNFKRQKVDLATTSAMGISKAALAKIDGFDYRFNFNHADGDVFIRLRKLGYDIIFNPKIIAHHHVRYGPSRNAYMIGLDTGIYYRKHVRPKTVFGFLGALLNIAVLTSYWIYSCLRLRRLKPLGGITGFIRGLTVSY